MVTRRSLAILAIAASLTLAGPAAAACVAVPGPDVPDLSFVDSDCDGIDGSASLAFFVSTAGSDAATGGMNDPFRTIQRAVDAAYAAPARKHVLVMGGIYDEGPGVALRQGVSIFGGYEFGWTRSNGAATIVRGAPQAVLADNLTGVTLQLVQLDAMESPISDR